MPIPISIRRPQQAQSIMVQTPESPEHDRSSTHTSVTDVEAAGSDNRADEAPRAAHKDDPNVVDWDGDGDGDPEKAINWPARRKCADIVMLAALTLLTPFCSSMFAPGAALAMAEFQSASDDRLAALAVPVYLLGYAFGPLAMAPPSELYGRLPVFHASTALFLVCNAGCTRAASAAMLVAFQRESYPPAILERRARRLRRETGNAALRSALQSASPPRKAFLTAIVRPTKLLFLSPLVLGLSLLTAVVYGILYLFFITVADLFVALCGVPPARASLVYLACGAGQLVGVLALGALSDRLLRRRRRRMVPEDCLPPLLPALVCLPASLLAYGWAAHARLPPAVPLAATAALGLGAGPIFMPVATYLVDAFAVALAPMVWLFWRHGESLRTDPRWRVRLD